MGFFDRNLERVFLTKALGSIESLLSAVVANGMTLSDKHNSDRELIG